MYDNTTDDFRAGLYQTVTGLPDGTYCLKVQARKEGAFYKKAHIYAAEYGGAKKRMVIPTTTEMQSVFIRDIEVTNGQCTFGVDVDVFGGMWAQAYVFLNDVEFFQQSDGSTPGRVPTSGAKDVKR
jgi:hypothetical protein